MLRKLGGGAGGNLFVLDRAADPQDAAATEDAKQVHAVGGFEPLDVAEAMQLARAAQVAQR
ncbi:MAG: hypothetical protein LH616_05590 [Ilumatobacteraceae bacterium]|nr:hypothetical protein [Ilumatobacteraceae bacterium]